MTNSQQQVRKAVIPAAGFGTRMFPATKAVKKELLPIIDRQGRAKPIVLAIVEEALSAGISEVAIVVQPGDRENFQDFFTKQPAYLHKLSEEKQQYCEYLQEVGEKITILTQEVPEGFGHAVFCAREWVGEDPFLLLLGDHLYASQTETSCARQLVEVFGQVGKSAIGVRVTPSSEIHHYGCVTGTWQKDAMLEVSEICEKPDINYARRHLHVEGMASEEFLSVFGLYLLTANIFQHLEENIKCDRRDRGEFQLTSCLEKLRQSEGIMGYVVKGKSFDTGLPQFYRQAMIEFPECRPVVFSTDR
ncbi:MAG: UTP--glucose-1-phosphate uridylyltransferase [Hormoscilla sp.]